MNISTDNLNIKQNTPLPIIKRNKQRSIRIQHYQTDSVNFNSLKKGISFSGLLNKVKAIIKPEQKKDGIIVLPTISEKKLQKEKDKIFRKNVQELKKLMRQTGCPEDYANKILENTNENNAEAALFLYKKHKYYNSAWLPDVLQYTDESNINIVRKTYQKLSLSELSHIMRNIPVKALRYVDLLCTKKPHLIEHLPIITRALQNAEDDGEFSKEYFDKLIGFTEKILSEKDEYASVKVWGKVTPVFERKKYVHIIECVNPANIDIAVSMWDKKKIEPPAIAKIIMNIDNSNADEAKEIIKGLESGEIDEKALNNLLTHVIGYKQYKQLSKKLGKRTIKKLSTEDLLIACRLTPLCNVNDISEIKLSEKRNLLKSLLQSVRGKYRLNSNLKPYFPLAPSNTKEYCALIPKIVNSLGIQTTPLSEREVDKFNLALYNLSQTLSKMSDTQFKNLKISQEFTKDDFIKSVLNEVKNLSSDERQKVYDYFGFELHHSKYTPIRYTMVGYPKNPDNKEKISAIKKTETRAVIEKLKPYVIKFSEQNRIKIDDEYLEFFLNETVKVLPELSTTIGKKQHGAHEYDIFRHSLKVMQKISQSIEFELLNKSDKKIILMAALLHDITKSEGERDLNHADTGSFDAFFISKKFNLSKEEQNKLYKIIKHHEWLGYTNTSKSKAHLKKRLQSVAFDLQQDNLFNMALIFAHADLKSVTKDDSFHDEINGKYHIGLDGISRSYGETADLYGDRIKEYIEELKTSQPLLPVTKFPPADIIKAKITQINPDGTTDIKGLYVDSKGMPVIKFNEVENWEDLGFPKGTVSKGIEASGISGHYHKKDVDTGNLKFFVHGLDYENQLAKFDAFSLIDSDALLSVSYAERPESKYRFFRPQGVILDVDTDCIYGGGNTDTGSGYAKTISNFKHHYIFGGERAHERDYISKLIRRATGMNDFEYMKFVEKNKNKSMLEIEPEETREKIIKIFSTINSNIRYGEREYNEMYISNPTVMGVFAYAPTGGTGNPVRYLEKDNNLDFLKQYALEKNIPFVIFGRY